MTVQETHLPLPDRRQGKVRDVYTIPAQGSTPPRLLIVATDRLSAFDVVLPTPIPGKGKMLTKISLEWFAFIRKLGIIPDHLISTDPADVPGLTTDQRRSLEGRIMITRAAQVVPIEFVVRGYLAGSGWAEYTKSQTVCGIHLPAGLKKAEKIPSIGVAGTSGSTEGGPIFTPATKASVGHDENISFEQACQAVGTSTMMKLRDVSIRTYKAAADFAATKGIILADTKFEFGHALDANGKPTSELMLIDEVLTPDSSRFWPADSHNPGAEPPSFDKQFVRNYLEGLVAKGGWNKTYPGPALPNDVVTKTQEKYQEAYERLFG
ncbi:MAG TPA: phosphoribosylaminoimidazolesuccinocarboxamide synthase [Phycisphaerales bacterium]|nr:phosphoribosylaminoimidazolesuccinocarboxamide synthase [Phycisphaerales bacterium]